MSQKSCFLSLEPQVGGSSTILTIVLSSIFHWDNIGVEVLGKIKGGASFPIGLPIVPRTMKYFTQTVRAKEMWRLTGQFPTAFVMAIVGVVDSMVASRENATKYGYAVSPNRELVALGGL